MSSEVPDLQIQAKTLGAANQLPGMYNLVASAATAELASLAYHDEAAWQIGCAGVGYEAAKLLSQGTAQIGICASPEAIVIAVRGTSTGKDWRDDFAITRVRWPNVIPAGGGKISRGFKRHINQILPVLRDVFYAYRQEFPKATVYVTGHSLGGAIAPLVALALLFLERQRVTGCYPHEMPRVGSRRFSQWYSGTALAPITFRTVTFSEGRQDLITRVPPSGWPFRFCHLGRVEMLYHDPDSGRIERIEGEEAWERYRADHAVSYIAAWRILTKYKAGREAHAIGLVVEATRAELNGGSG